MACCIMIVIKVICSLFMYRMDRCFHLYFITHLSAQSLLCGYTMRLRFTAKWNLHKCTISVDGFTFVLDEKMIFINQIVLYKTDLHHVCSRRVYMASPTLPTTNGCSGTELFFFHDCINITCCWNYILATLICNCLKWWATEIYPFSIFPM